MVDLHRRVEKRSFTGTGITADQEKIEDLEHERKHRERAERPQPKERFKAVLKKQAEPTEGKSEAKQPVKEQAEPLPQKSMRRASTLFQRAIRDALAEHEDDEPAVIAVTDLPRQVK